MDGTTKGATTEYLVAIDLLNRGFEVYRNMSPTGPTDMIASKHIDDWYVLNLRVQVKTNYGHLTEKELAMNDIVAFVDKKKVRYRVSPGLTKYFENSLAKNLDKDDCFAVTRHPRIWKEAFGNLVIKIHMHDQNIRPSLHNGGGPAIREFIIPIPPNVDANAFGHKASIVMQKIIDDSMVPSQLPAKFEKFPELMGVTV